MSPAITDLTDLAHRLRRFADERDWEPFHSPKNLAMALIVEAGELVEHFQWLTEQQSRNPDAVTRTEVAHEMADVLIYLVRMADQLDIDLLAAATEKITLNAEKYPCPAAKDRTKKQGDR